MARAQKTGIRRESGTFPLEKKRLLYMMLCNQLYNSHPHLSKVKKNDYSVKDTGDFG